MLSFWQFVTLVLAALGLTMTSAHVLEMPQKMTYSAELYAAVNTTLYRYFAIVGGAYQVGGIVSAWILTSLLKRRRLSYKWAFTGAALLLLSFLSWLTLVEPVNLQIEAALAAAPETIPSLWQVLRNRWEYGHATGFVLHLLGFCALVVSLIRENDGPAFVRRSPLPLA
jgi:MFS family permease